MPVDVLQDILSTPVIPDCDGILGGSPCDSCRHVCHWRTVTTDELPWSRDGDFTNHVPYGGFSGAKPTGDVC